MIFPGAERFRAMMHEKMRYVKVFGLLIFRLTLLPMSLLSALDRPRHFYFVDVIGT
jgi:hypothetical protein